MLLHTKSRNKPLGGFDLHSRKRWERSDPRSLHRAVGHLCVHTFVLLVKRWNTNAGAFKKSKHDTRNIDLHSRKRWGQAYPWSRHRAAGHLCVHTFVLLVKRWNTNADAFKKWKHDTRNIDLHSRKRWGQSDPWSLHRTVGHLCVHTFALLVNKCMWPPRCPYCRAPT